MKTFPTLVISSFLSLVAATSCRASENADQCTDLVKECFAYSGQERDTCFRASAEHTFCAGTEIGSLADKRGQFSLLNPDNGDIGPSFLGTQLIDRACLANFDNAWSGSLIKGAPSREAYVALAGELQHCAHAPASDMIRP
jgi:hypothetical protein